MGLLIIVEETFQFQDGTIHFAPAVSFEVIDRERIREGDRLELRRPDGTAIMTTLHSLDFLKPSNGKCGLCVNRPRTKSDIPAGTEIWTIP
jgi:hypothetical protein